MIEEDRRRAEEVRRALGEFLDRLAKAIVEGLAGTDPIAHPPRPRSVRPPADRTDSSG
jgi:hypothetical protein